MSLKKKTPAKAATKARGTSTTRQTKHTDNGKACKCPRCGFKAGPALFVQGWLDDLQQRALRFWQMGFGPDLSAMSLVELYALWRWLLKQS